MNQFRLLGVKITPSSKKEVLENIQINISKKTNYTHIVSLNSENVVTASELETFKKVVETAQIQILDGSGVVTAIRLLGGHAQPRLTGVDLMEELCKMAYTNSLSVLLIGGRPKVALKLAECQNEKYSSTLFYGFECYKDKNHPTDEEEQELFSIVAARKPSFVFVSFGSPFQELWIDRHKALFKNSVCMGVGGAFDFLSGEIARSPKLVSRLGFEWLYRLIRQPWRWKRQLKLITFMSLVLKQRIGISFQN